MGKYRLKSKQKGSVITLMEVDTECQAWYIQADDRNAALQVLKAMSDEIRCLRNIYLNGDDVTEEVCPLLMTIGDASLPEEEFSEMYGAGNPDVGMDMHRTEDSSEGEADSETVFKLFFERIAVFRERASCFCFPNIRFRREENGRHPFRQITY